MPDNKKIDAKELEEKVRRVMSKSENPTTKEYGDRLAEFLDSKATTRDNFINWITGLATGSMFLAFSYSSSAIPKEKLFLLFSGIASFLCIISALTFKILLEKVRFNHSELELSLLKSIWEGHNLKAELDYKKQSNEIVTKEDIEKLTENRNETSNYLDDGYVNNLKKSINLKAKIWDYSYWTTLALFLIALSFMVIHHIMLLA